jgi:uncharacterized protein YjdB
MKINRLAAALATCAVGLLAFVPASSAATATAAPTARHANSPRLTLTAPKLSAVAKAELAKGRKVCYSAHVQNIGWQSWVCDGAVAGTVGQSLQMEAISIITHGTGGICANAHVQNIGWQGQRCAKDGDAVTVGTVGQSLRLESLVLSPRTGTICANAHVQNIGWQGLKCGSSITVGTIGQSLRLEAIMITV